MKSEKIIPAESNSYCRINRTNIKYLDNAGQVIFAVAVLTPLIEKSFDKSSTPVVAFGLIGVLFCWIISIRLAKKKEDYDI